MTDSADPKRENALKDNEEPKCKKSRTESAAPSRAKDLRDNVEPMFTTSRIAMEEAKRAHPKSENADPKRHMLRSDIVEPRSTKSITDS